jgi:hypothetical protein
MKKMTIKLLGLLLILTLSLSATEVVENQMVDNGEKMTEVSLDTLGDSGMIVLIVLSSLLGAYFMRDELEGTFS